MSSSRDKSSSQTQTRSARSSSLDGSVCTVSSESVYTVYSVPSIPSIDVEEEDLEDSSSQVPFEVNVEDGNEEQPTATVSVDHERQVLLLFLLAQVCALHDPTPRTFTVHVLGLFEQGILDREAIQFLFELGFVPSSNVDSRDLLAIRTPNSASPIKTRNRRRSLNNNNNARIIHDDFSSDDIFDRDDSEIKAPVSTSSSSNNKIETVNTSELALARPTNVLHSTRSAVPGVTSIHSNQTLRSLEASAIREKLTEHDNMHHDSIRKKKNKQKNSKNSSVDEGPPSPVENDRQRSWDVKQFPLSMSRYQREFKEIAPISSGSFGSVFRAIRELDGYEYAVKKITFDAAGYSNESIEQVIREVQCLAAVNDHPNIVRYYTSWWEPTWMTGSIPNKKQHKMIENGSKGIRKRLLQIENGEANDKSGEWSVESSSSSSSSWSSESDDDYYSLDGGVRSVEDSTWGSYPRHKSYDDSYMTKSASRRTRRSNRKAKKATETSTPYQYQISLYIQMQLCHPANLQDWIRERNKQIPESDHQQRIGPAVEIFQQICSGLAHIHNSNVVHRDLKPANIFVSSDGKVIKIGDFGLSKKLRDLVNQQHQSTFSKPPPPDTHPPEEQTSNAIIPVRPSAMHAIVQHNKVGKNLTSGIGTASYAAPEQVQSKTYGTAVDIFSLGLIFLELVSCFETEHERLHNLQQCRYQRLPNWLSDHYPEISSTILACTSPNPLDRPTANELAAAAKLNSPRNQKEFLKLKRQLADKNREIAEKDKTIENMRSEIKRLQELLLSKTGSSPELGSDQPSTGANRADEITVTDVLTFDDDIE